MWSSALATVPSRGDVSTGIPRNGPWPSSHPYPGSSVITLKRSSLVDPPTGLGPYCAVFLDLILHRMAFGFFGTYQLNRTLIWWLRPSLFRKVIHNSLVPKRFRLLFGLQNIAIFWCISTVYPRDLSSPLSDPKSSSVALGLFTGQIKYDASGLLFLDWNFPHKPLKHVIALRTSKESDLTYTHLGNSHSSWAFYRCW